MAEPRQKRRVVIVGAGFAGFNAARELSRLMGSTIEIMVINSTDYFLYLPLMPQVAGGVLEPRHIRASLTRRLRTIPLSGPVASAVTRGYHLGVMSGNRARVLTDWSLNAVTPQELTSLDVITAKAVPLDVEKPRT